LKFRLALVLASVGLFGACSTPITVRSIAESDAPEESRNHAIALLEEAVDQANAFLASKYRLSLPAGHYEEGEDGFLVFVTAEKRWPMRIYNSFGGELVVAFGFRAQERDDGFVVGSYPPDEYPEIDNSMFRYPDGDWLPADSVAQLILHETAHTINGEGTVGYWNTVKYYAEAIFLFRTNDHSDERIPMDVNFEFRFSHLIEEARAKGDHPMADAYQTSFDKHHQELQAAASADSE
jgi:hypothetical protein